MEPVNIEEARRRIALRRRLGAQDRAGAWIGHDPILGDICTRLIGFDPVIGDDDADPDVRRRALEAAVASGAVTVAEVALLDAAIVRAREVYPDMVVT